tara:strand:- start:56 stop:784 length:729 start_codon:yes stop_codon:yes gene_type:complete
MALTKVGKEGVVGLDNSADATAITISSGEVVTLSNNLITNGNVLRGANDSSNTLSGGTASNSGGNIGVYGSSHSSLASNIRFRSGSTVTMLMDSTGAMTKPLQPAFYAAKTSTQSNIDNSGSQVDVPFDSERFDQNADFASNVFTAPVTGKYYLKSSLYLSAVDTAADYYAVRVNTSNKVYVSIFTPKLSADVDFFSLTVDVVADMDASDTAKIQIFQSGGSQQTDINGNDSYTYFCGYLVA